ncbi:TPA: hypothetical protein JLI46_000843 [Escherichia coli]|uniref:hypothetical protein n=1 Tax=Escherichia sp. TaxID=1884818 RepID=UPI002582EB2C|nr:hypothetical protein [Escherichia sp.]HBB9656183.1 hypothetical protein [Escherichia coli]
MTNVSAVEKMAELMQQMEENSPRVAALQYCLTQVAEKVEEAEKRNAELEARCAALSAENSGLKSAIDATIGWQQSTDPENVESVRMLVDVKTPVTDAFLAEVRASGVDASIEHLIKKFEGTGHIGVPVMALEWLAQKLRKGGAA